MSDTFLLTPTPEPTESPTPSDAETSSSSYEVTAASELEGVSVSGSDILTYSAGETVGETIDYSSYFDAILASEQRQEEQLEGALSILLIFAVVGLLNYIYKFFKMFF